MFNTTLDMNAPVSKRVPLLEMTLPAEAENVAVIRHAITGLAEALPMDAELLDNIKLAVSEACTNVVMHAYDDTEGCMDVSLDYEEDTITVIVRDYGKGIRPRTDSPGLGVGLPMIATLTDSLELLGDADQPTEVHMTFQYGIA